MTQEQFKIFMEVKQLFEFAHLIEHTCESDTDDVDLFLADQIDLELARRIEYLMHELSRP